jgi:LPXTG-motif cell wall-anchored protein
MRTSLLPAALAVSLLLPALSLADIPIPGQPFRPRGPIERPEPAPETAAVKPAVVKREVLKHADIKDARTIKAKLVIPRSLLPVAKDAPAAKPVKAAPEAPKTGSIGPTGTIVAGIALSLAAVSCVFLFRKNKAGGAAVVGVLVVAGTVGVWSAANANAPAPRPQPVEATNAPAFPRSGNKNANDSVILLEVVEEGDSITLVLPK